ncbi:MAG: acyl carrier protein [Lachnospiraceae bacterium]|nr:acyl carrier protein [Lachnospiraceae bacterium]
MERSEILSVLNAKIKEIKDNGKVLNEEDYLDFRGAGLNSLELMTLIVYLEDYYEIEFADEDLLISEYVYIKDLMDVVCKKMQSESL